MVYIYAITAFGNKWYIGKANDVQERLKAHLLSAFRPRDSMYNGKFYQWIRKLENPALVKLYIVETVSNDNWEETEIRWIDAYRRMYGRGNVLNQHTGGRGFATGLDHPKGKYSEEIKAEIIETAGQISPKDWAKRLNTSAKVIRSIRQKGGANSWYQELLSERRVLAKYIRNNYTKDHNHTYLASLYGVSREWIAKVFNDPNFMKEK